MPTKRLHSQVKKPASNDKLTQKVRELDVATCYLHHILRHIAQGMLFIHTSGMILGVSHAAEAILEQSAIDILFTPYAKHFADNVFGFSMKKALKARHVPKEWWLISYHDGSTQRMLEVEGCFITHEMPFPLPSTRSEDLNFTEGILLFFRDVTARETQRQQEERNTRLRQLGEMVSSIAHEIRNPLGGIKGFASLLQRDLSQEPHLQKMAGYILEGANHLNRLIDTMLRYTKPIMPTLQTVDLVVFLLDFLYHVRMDSTLQQAEYSVDFAEGSLYAEVDTGLLHAALLNLIANAVQAMPNGGDVFIGLHQEGKNAVLVIQDTGEGITKENLDKIFQPFFTTKATGSGFGLSETLKIVQAHHGTIGVESQIGAGTTFKLYMPMTSPPKPTPKTRRKKPSKGK